MGQYVLKDEEVYLFKGKAKLFEEDPIFKNTNAKSEVEIRLTNLNLVLNIVAKENDAELDNQIIYSINNLKCFNEKYQIIRDDTIVSMYFTDGEIYFEFDDANEAKEFVGIGLKLASGCSKIVRAAKSVQNEIKSAEEALDIDIKGTAKKVASFAGNIYLGATSRGKPLVGAVTRALSKKKDDSKNLK